MKITIIGGTGYIGENITKDLMADNQIVIASRNIRASHIEYNHNVKHVMFDVNSFESVDFVANSDALIYLACNSNPFTSNKDYSSDIQTNMLSAVRVFTEVAKMGVKKIVFSSSAGAIYENKYGFKCSEDEKKAPVSSYGIVKLALEGYLNLIRGQFGVDFNVLRIANPYGSIQDHRAGTGVIASIISSVINNESIKIWGDGTIKRDFLYISDLVAAFRSAVYLSTESKIFNIGSGTSYSINQVIQEVEKIANLKLTVKYTQGRGTDLRSVDLDIGRAQSELNWVPKISLEDGIFKMINGTILRGENVRSLR